MTIQLDHFIVPTRDQVASAKRLASILGVEWAERGVGPFSPVYLNDGCTLDFQTTGEDFPIHHFAFRVTDSEFDAILGRLRAQGIPFRGSVHGPMDDKVGEFMGGRLVYWTEPDGHFWEILTVSYARPGAKP